MDKNNNEQSKRPHGHGNLKGNILLIIFSCFFAVFTPFCVVILWNQSECAVPLVKDFFDTMIGPIELPTIDLSNVTLFQQSNSSSSDLSSSSEPTTSDVSGSTSSSLDASSSESSSSSSSSDSSSSSSTYSVKDDLRNALFIGDAYTDGLSIYAGIEKKRAFSNANMTTASVFSKTITVDDKELTLNDCLINLKPKGIFIQLGSNEIAQGYSAQKLLTRYESLVEKIAEQSPTSHIYIQSVFPVTESYSDSHETGLNNTNIKKFNDSLQQFAEEKGYVYLNVADSVCDTADVLSSNASSDGYHLKPASYNDWLTFLQTQN